MINCAELLLNLYMVSVVMFIMIYFKFLFGVVLFLLFALLKISLRDLSLSKKKKKLFEGFVM